MLGGADNRHFWPLEMIGVWHDLSGAEVAEREGRDQVMSIQCGADS